MRLYLSILVERLITKSEILMNLAGTLTNSSRILSPSSPPEIGSSNQLGNTTDGVPNTSSSPSSPKSPSKKKELKEKDSSHSTSSSPSKDSSSPFSSKKIQMPLPPFSHRLKKKDQDHIEKIRETFSQVKINIPLLDVI